ncbi:DUF421 domain-containing protein [Gracilibacillus alcaliphilus]|uniref:DUF421 domain-containing protein n=1 Tax=Gracilibacillus alcaliphilus TaxID=1401441 RepID=UPI001EF8CC2D|nr:DUF421 domain-containing protein [Gracilibacillus alcaliphilus]MBM7678584.1 uncharacterized membrane protein YcaP (DUF421 family) [Gracilibacillus alcaliphilus]
MGIEEAFLLIARTLFYYFAVVVVFRLMGKREVGELSIFDIVVYIMIAEIAVISIDELDKFFGYGLIPMAVLLAIQRVTALISLKSPSFRNWFEGKPAIIISQGKIDEYQMKKNRVNFDDLIQQLRQQGTKSIQDVDYAILEPSGNLSIIEKEKNQVSTDQINGLVMPLIIDGRLQEQALLQLKKDKQWLLEELQKRNFQTIEEVSFCSIDNQNEWYIDKKNEKI